MDVTDLERELSDIVTTVGRVQADLAGLDPAANLFDLGMSSYNAVQVMMAIEDRYALEFPDALLRKEHFASVRALAAAIASIRA